MTHTLVLGIFEPQSLSQLRAAGYELYLTELALVRALTEGIMAATDAGDLLLAAVGVQCDAAAVVRAVLPTAMPSEAPRAEAAR